MPYEAKLSISFIVVLDGQSIICLPEDRVGKSRILHQEPVSQAKVICCTITAYLVFTDYKFLLYFGL
jgi:hypothetical protein